MGCRNRGAPGGLGVSRSWRAAAGPEFPKLVLPSASSGTFFRTWGACGPFRGARNVPGEGEGEARSSVKQCGAVTVPLEPGSARHLAERWCRARGRVARGRDPSAPSAGDVSRTFQTCKYSGSVRVVAA